MDLQTSYSKSQRDTKNGSNLDVFEAACAHGDLARTLKGRARDDSGTDSTESAVMFSTRRNGRAPALTFQVQVAGSIGVLSYGA